MSITNRLSWYFLTALGTVLIGFSTTLYLLASWHLHAQLNRHLESAIHVLIAAVEVHSKDVQWEPLERRVPLGEDGAADQVRWAIHDHEGKLVDRSANLAEPPRPTDDGDWQILRRRLSAGQFDPAPVNDEPTTFPKEIEGALPEDRSAKSSAFTVSVALSTLPMHALLTNLTLAMVAVSTIIWLSAAVWSRWLCQRALRPMRQMAASARALEQAPESTELLHVPASDDELTDLGGAFNDLLMMLRATAERQRRFASDASHQLRTPLAVMLAAVDVSLRRDRDGDDYRRILSVVQRRGRELTSILETLMLLTRGDEEARAEFETIELNQLCQQRVREWQDRPRAGDLQLEPGSGPFFVRSHALLVGQVVDNLIDNACKYSEEGTPVAIRLGTQGGESFISVSDQGPGIPPDELTRVFVPFFRGSAARWNEQAGEGLGLPIARRLAGLAGGQLQVESELGKGTTFRLVLAVADGDGVPARK